MARCLGCAPKPSVERRGAQMSRGGAAGNTAGYPSSGGVSSSRRRYGRPVARGTSKKKRLHTNSGLAAQPPSHRISFQRTTRPRREPREHADVSELSHSPLLIPARPPRCFAMRNRSLTAIIGHTYRGRLCDAIESRERFRIRWTVGQATGRLGWRRPGRDHDRGA